MVILGIETSCDETSAAVIADGRVTANLIYTQQMHATYGGVIPELSSRAHLLKIAPLVRTSLSKAGIELKDVDVVAATAGPGLIGSLIVGYTFAQGLALSLGKPFIPVNHIEGHIYSGFLMNPAPEFPALILVVSGGHTLLLNVRSHTSYQILGTTADDAAGEAFDKVAKLMNLGYPGGPAIQKSAEKAVRKNISFPIADVKGDYNFSYSGLKTSVLRYIQKNFPDGVIPPEEQSEIAYGFQESAVGALIAKTELALRQASYRSISVAGGVAANGRLRDRLADLSAKYQVPLVVPAFEFCTDNGAMIAARAKALIESGIPDYGIQEPFPSFKSVFADAPLVKRS
ncbi:MAG: tRNA N6-adenosine threonylcarbamoyltransferase [Ignavibacteriaceae bacterium]|nr:tRNA N6-adenosine threonylcarbamoyltransferase [Ignavibacteriaceae bacterium]